MTATATILVSRFPGTITPGALLMLPDLVSIHDDLLTGGVLVFRWFAVEGQEELEQSAPTRYATVTEAWLDVPPDYTAILCPRDFARIAYRRRAV